MVGSKYLSELVTPDMLVRDKLNIVKAPTGSGKTYFALTAIPEALGEDAAYKVIYLIDTINGREQLPVISIGPPCDPSRLGRTATPSTLSLWEAGY